MDVEVAATIGRGRLGQGLAVVLGIAAVLGAVLGTIEMTVRKDAERAQFVAARMSVDAYGRETVQQIVSDAQAAATAQARTAAIQADYDRERAAGPSTPAVDRAVADADVAAAARLAALAASVGRAPDASSGVDGLTREAMVSDPSVLRTLEGRTIHQLSDARRSGAKRGRAVFALSLVAMAGVLAGLAAVFGAGRSGSLCLVVAAAALAAAAVWGVTAIPLGS